MEFTNRSDSKNNRHVDISIEDVERYQKSNVAEIIKLTSMNIYCKRKAGGTAVKRFAGGTAVKRFVQC